MTTGVAPDLERARAASARMAWEEASESFERADRSAPLGAEDLERMATTAFMLGRMDAFVALLERAHHAHAEAGRGCPAARCAFFIGVNLTFRGELARGTGWFARGQRLGERGGAGCAEQGRPMLPAGVPAGG